MYSTSVFWPYSYPFIPETMTLWNVFVFITGACVGSFLNVCIWRIPRDESVFAPSSHCPVCGHVLSWFENIPMLSWICLNGHCRECSSVISSRYFFVELITAIMFLTVWLRVTLHFENLASVFPMFVVIMLVVTTVFIDIEHRIIPNETTYAAIIAGFMFSIIFPEIWGTESRIISFIKSFSGFVAGGVFFAFFAVIGRMIFKREALGWGDVKYLAAVGACLGFAACLFTVLLGALAGSLGGIITAFVKRKNIRKTAIPFGPYLAAGTYIWMIYGERLLRLYVDFLKSFSHTS